jgi:4'-phosphopantetheinyl transferase EntD
MDRADALCTAIGDLLARLRLRDIGHAVSDLGGALELLPDEEALAAGKSPRNHLAFRAGRHCARAALTLVGGPSSTPIRRGALGEPVWPEGYAGSISHDGAYAAAVAYRSAEGLVWLSLDLVELGDDDAFLEALDTICAPGEMWATVRDPLLAARLLTAKEVAVKILSPMWRRPVGFGELTAEAIGTGMRVTSRDASHSIAVALVETAGFIVSVGFSEQCYRAAASASRRRILR